ncbi:hypothetical protein M3Y97_00505900 [Aphelenchoides bicaudatus]|nr:hypothetical protein M3Y97_00505900 [Aphelenchoides bicaudatus]
MSNLSAKPRLNFECRAALVKFFIADSKWERKFKNFKRQCVLSKSFSGTTRFLMKNCRFLDTSLSQTVRLLFHKGSKASIPMKEELLFGILQLVRPLNFTLGGFYSSDSKRVQSLFERSGFLLNNQLQHFSFNGRLSCANESVELVREIKQMSPKLETVEVGFFIVIDHITKSTISKILKDAQDFSNQLNNCVNSISINLNIGLLTDEYSQQLEIIKSPTFFNIQHTLNQSVDNCNNPVLLYRLKDTNCLILLEFRKSPVWTYNPITESFCANP